MIGTNELTFLLIGCCLGVLGTVLVGGLVYIIANRQATVTIEPREEGE